MEELDKKGQIQRERRGSDLRDELLRLSIGYMRWAWWCSEQGHFHALLKKKETSRFRTLLLSKAHAKRWWKAHARFSKKATFGWFWRLLAAFWESWKAIKEEEIVRRNHNNLAHAYRGCEKEKRRHVSWGCASEEKARISRHYKSDNSARKSRQHEEEEDKIKIFWEWEWECDWDLIFWSSDLYIFMRVRVRVRVRVRW